ncbi:DUF302 domain-containing protein [Halobacterium noricense]|uniref:DUF302 domain-containing protein n=1 Tax=Halobacterium noricense TaxID=223182 RepID=UPI001E3F6E20|nr:DUF302 domain-containing protein [Halobacterium noricense]UHH25816.1 DUF302 domain-containing protein [Halobacterium noricense]
MLPNDPSDIDPEEYGEEQAVLAMDHEEAVEHVREAFSEAGFGFPAEFSPSELLNEKVDREAQSASGSRPQSDDADRDPYYVLGACNPEVADRALDASDNKIGALFPCNVVVWQEEPGKQRVYHVSIMRIARLLGMAPDDETWAEIVAETGEYVDEAFANLETAD